MTWDQIETTPAHITYIGISIFLLVYAVFSDFIRNRLHLSEPPLAVLFGIIVGPYALGLIDPVRWGSADDTLMEFTRVIVGIQVFTVGVELPKFYISRHWRSIAMMLGPIMTVSWFIPALFASWIFKVSLPTGLIIGACLSPTDPVLSASVLSNSRFSNRVPQRIRHMLSAESGSNDGTAFPFLYIGLEIFKESTAKEAIKEWFLITILWQCTVGIIVGLVVGFLANKVVRYSYTHAMVSRPAFLALYLLLALLSVGIGSTLGLDDFLVAFSAGIGFARGDWFGAKMGNSQLPNTIDLLLNSALFVYFGAIIPWDEFVPRDITPYLDPGRLIAFLVFTILFRRIPIMLALKPLVPDLRTYREALFAGHFGPMGVGAMFLAMEARAQLETGTSLPLPRPPEYSNPHQERDKAIAIVWPVVCFVVLGSTIIHGLSVVAISIGSHLSRKEGERAPLLGSEEEPLDAMVHGDEDSEPGNGGHDEEEF